ncbi:MAG: glycosyltransferase [Nanoarchaeota archaeon]
MKIINEKEGSLVLKSGLTFQGKQIKDLEVDKEIQEALDNQLLHVYIEKQIIDTDPNIRNQKEAIFEDDFDEVTPKQPDYEFAEDFHKPHGVALAKDPYEHYKKTGTMQVEWTGPTLDLGGYANMNRSYIFRLQDKKDIRIKYDLLPSLNDLDENTFRRLTHLRNTEVSETCPKVYGMTVPQMSPSNRYNIYYTMMETVGIHKIYAERCDLCNELWLPTQFCIDQFKGAGVRTKITKMPLGVDDKLFNRNNIKPLKLTIPLKKFVFFSVFGWSYRKGYDILLKAFCEEFTSKDDVSLLISSRFYGSISEDKKERIRQDTRNVLAMVNNKDLPHISLFGDLMPVDLMPSFFALADAFVLISRGEGFGLPYCEASLMGLPVIGSYCTGQTEFLTEDNSFIVEPDCYEIADKRMNWISHFYEGQKFPEFKQPAIEKTRAHMRYVYENYELAKQKNEKLKELVLEKYTWDISANRARDRLIEIYNR